jgi:hypothetical protein
LKTKLLGAVAVFLIVFPFAAAAQEPGEKTLVQAAPPGQAATATPAAPAAAIDSPDPTDPDALMDLGDLFRAIRNKDPKPPPDAAELGRPMITAAPIIGSNPSTGVSIGAAAQVAFIRGDPETTHISSLLSSLTYTTKNQLIFNARFGMFTGDDRWFIEGDNRIQLTAQDTYGLGTNTPDSAAIDTNFDFYRIHETAYRRVRKSLFVGGGFLFDAHANVKGADGVSLEGSPYETYSLDHGLPIDRQISAGISANVLFDTRDNFIDPQHGMMANAAYRFSFGGFLGGDSAWQSLHLEFRAYAPLPTKRRQHLGFWYYTDLTTTGAPPYFDLPTTVMDLLGRSARGYREGRYRGERLMYGEVEYRSDLMQNGLLGMVAFSNLTTVTNLEAGERLFESSAPAFGAGLRLLLNKRSRTNLCFDVAWGKSGSHGVYLAIQDAF